MKQIVLKFDKKTGEVLVEAMGFKGSSCEAATKFLADTLGKSHDFQRKSEWFEQNLEEVGSCNTNYCG